MFRWYWTISPQALAGTIYFCGEAVTRGDDEVAAAREPEGRIFSSPYGRIARVLEERWSRHGDRRNGSGSWRNHHGSSEAP